MLNQETLSPHKLREYVEKFKEDPSTLIAFPLAEDLGRRGRYRDAVKILTEALAFHPDTLLGHLTLAHCYAKLAKDSEALEHLKESTRVSPGNPQAYFQSAEIHHKRGNIPKALAALKRALQTDPEHEQAKRLHDHLRAVWDADKAAGRVPESAQVPSATLTSEPALLPAQDEEIPEEPATNESDDAFASIGGEASEEKKEQSPLNEDEVAEAAYAINKPGPEQPLPVKVPEPQGSSTLFWLLITGIIGASGYLLYQIWSLIDSK